MLEKWKSVLDKAVGKLKAEFFKEGKDLVPTIFSEICSKRSFLYNLCHFSEFSTPNVKSTVYGTEKFILSRTKNLGFNSKRAERGLKLKCL